LKGTPKVEIGFDDSKNGLLVLQWSIQMRDTYDPHGKFNSRFELILQKGKPVLVISNGRTDKLRQVYTGFEKDASIQILQALLNHNGHFDSITHYDFPPTDEGEELISVAMTPPIRQSQHIESEIVAKMLDYLLKDDSTVSTQNRSHTTDFSSQRTP